MKLFTLHVLRHDPIMEQPIVFYRALHCLHQQIIGGGPCSVGLALGLSTVNQTGEEEEEVVDIPQKLLPLTGELKRRLVFEDAGGKTKEPCQAIVFDCSILLVQDLTAGSERVRFNDYIKAVSIVEICHLV